MNLLHIIYEKFKSKSDVKHSFNVEVYIQDIYIYI